jgi:hypothetical protein
MGTTDPARHTTTRTETLVNSFLHPTPLIGPRQEAEQFLSCQDLSQVVEEMGPEDRRNLVDKLNQVCHPGSQSSLVSFPHVFPKIYETGDVKDVHIQFLALFGSFCSAFKHLPASVLLSAGLEKCGDVAVAPGGLTSLWGGRYNGIRVAIKAFHKCSPQNLQREMDVGIYCGNGSLHSNSTGFVGAGTNVEKTCSSKHCRISWRDHGTIPTRSRLRLGRR